MGVLQRICVGERGDSILHLCTQSRDTRGGRREQLAGSCPPAPTPSRSLRPREAGCLYACGACSSGAWGEGVKGEQLCPCLCCQG